MYWGGHLANPRIALQRAARVRVHAATPLPVQLDAHTPLDVEIQPGTLNLLV